MLSLANFNEARARLEANYKGTAKAIPWANIVSLLMTFLTGCLAPTPTPATVKASAAKETEYLAYAVRSQLIQDFGLGAWRTHDGPGIVASVQATIASADDTFIQGCLNDAA
jgi:hypothetical protein